MLASKLSRERLTDASAAALRLAIDGDGDSDPGAANGDAPIRLARRHRFGDLLTEHRIINAFGPVGAEITHLVTLLGEPPDELVLEKVAGMVGGEGDAHIG
jgi:hypothetical protein